MKIQDVHIFAFFAIITLKCLLIKSKIKIKKTMNPSQIPYLFSSVYPLSILFFGVTPPDKRITVSLNDIYKRQLKIVGLAINPLTHHRIVELLKVLDVKELVTHEYPLSDINKAIAGTKHSVGLKLCIRPNL